MEPAPEEEGPFLLADDSGAKLTITSGLPKTEIITR
jgi:hypothetical protein